MPARLCSLGQVRIVPFLFKGITEHSDALFLTPFLCMYRHIAWTKPKAFQEISNSHVSNVRHGEQRKGSRGLPHTSETVSAKHSSAWDVAFQWGTEGSGKCNGAF